jgi:hypothetical protein
MSAKAIISLGGRAQPTSANVRPDRQLVGLLRCTTFSHKQCLVCVPIADVRVSELEWPGWVDSGPSWL